MYKKNCEEMVMVYGNIPASVWRDSDGTELYPDREQTGHVSKSGLP
jgi:hypothetical protein